MIPTMVASVTLPSNVAAWREFESTSMTRVAPNGSGRKGRYFANGETKTLLWGVQPPSGDVDIVLNFHNTPAPGYDWNYNPPGGPDTTVSPLHIEWDVSKGCFVLTIEYSHSQKVMLNPVRGGWNALALEIFFHRTSGHIWGCWNGYEFDAGNVPTLNPYPQQAPFANLWQGVYPKGDASLGTKIVQSAVMVGSSRAEVMADQPRLVAAADNIVNGGTATLTAGASIDPKVLFDLVGWTTATPPPPPPPPPPTRTVKSVTISYSDGTTETRP